MTKTLAALRRCDEQHFDPVHCTGWVATAAFQREFPASCFRCTASTVLTFETLPAAPPAPSA